MEFKNKINFTDYCLFIDEVVSTVFITDEDGSCIYSPELLSPAMHLAFAKYYGDFRESGDFDADYETYMELNLSASNIDTLGVDYSQYAAIEEAIWEKIDFKKAQLLKSNISLVSVFDELLPVLQDFLGTVAEKVAAADFNTLPDEINA